MRNRHLKSLCLCALAALGLVALRPAGGASVAHSFPWPEEEVHAPGGEVIFRDTCHLWEDEHYRGVRAERRARLEATHDPLQRARLYRRMALRRLEEFKGGMGEGRLCWSLLEEWQVAVCRGMEELRYAQHLGRSEKRIKAELEHMKSTVRGHRALEEKVREMAHPDSEQMINRLFKWSWRKAHHWGRGQDIWLRPLEGG